MKNKAIATFVIVSKESIEKYGIYASIKSTIDSYVNTAEWFDYLRDNGTIVNIKKHSSSLDSRRFDGWVDIYRFEWKLSQKKHTYFFIKYGDKYTENIRKRFA